MNNETKELMEFDDVQSYEEFKNKYWGTVDKSGGSIAIPKVEKTVSASDTIFDKKFYKAEKLTINPKLKTDVKNGFIDAANQVYERFGRKISIDKIDVVKSGDTKYRQASYDPLTKTIKLVNSSMSTYEKKAEKLFADNWNASKDKYGTFYHEIGHAVWEDLSSEAKSQISAIYEAKKHEAYLKWMEAGGSSSGMSQTDYFGKTLSRYGATNKNEFFSEAFSQIMSGRMRPVSRQVNQILQEQYASVQLNKNLLDKSAQSGIIKESERFEIQPDKINKFLLKPGAKHSKEFFDVGYSDSDYEKLFDDISSEFDESKAVDIKKNADGTEDFSIFMNLGVKTKKRFRIVWRKDTPDSKPRLITGHRED